MPMKPTELREVKGLVKATFNVLRDQASGRRELLRRQLLQEILLENEEKLSRYEEEFKKLREDAQALMQRSNDLTRQANDDGVDIKSKYGGTPLAFDLSYKVEVRKLESEIRRRMNAILDESGFYKTNLDMMELDVLRDLVFNEMESQDAKKFLTKLPTIEQLIPLRNGDVLELPTHTGDE